MRAPSGDLHGTLCLLDLPADSDLSFLSSLCRSPSVASSQFPLPSFLDRSSSIMRVACVSSVPSSYSLGLLKAVATRAAHRSGDGVNGGDGNDNDGNENDARGSSNGRKEMSSGGNVNSSNRTTPRKKDRNNRLSGTENPMTPRHSDRSETSVHSNNNSINRSAVSDSDSVDENGLIRGRSKVGGGSSRVGDCNSPPDSSDSIIISDSDSDSEPPLDSTRRSVVTTMEIYESWIETHTSPLAPRKALKQVVQSSTICERVYRSQKFSPESRSRIYENESRLAQLLNGQEMNAGWTVESP